MCSTPPQQVWLDFDLQKSVGFPFKLSIRFCETTSGRSATDGFRNFLKLTIVPASCSVSWVCRGENARLNWTVFFQTSLNSFHHFLCEQPKATPWISLRTDAPEVCGIAPFVWVSASCLSLWQQDFVWNMLAVFLSVVSRVEIKLHRHYFSFCLHISTFRGYRNFGGGASGVCSSTRILCQPPFWKAVNQFLFLFIVFSTYQHGDTGESIPPTDRRWSLL